MLSVWLELEDFLVDGCGLWQEALGVQTVGNACELLDSAVQPACANVQIAKEIRRAPIAGLILHDETGRYTDPANEILRCVGSLAVGRPRL